jgi:hypothetical protein
MADVHTLVITKSAEQIEDSGLTGYDFEVICHGVDDACRAWWECGPGCPARSGNTDELYDNDMQLHGAEHRYIQDAWMVATDDCLLADHPDAMPDAVLALLLRERLDPGLYLVGHDFNYPDDGDICLDLVGSSQGAISTGTTSGQLPR